MNESSLSGGGAGPVPATLLAPIFPLPNATLFPAAVMPLHVFEPRYKAMVRAALEGHGMIAIAQLKPGWEGQYFGRPPIYRTMGIGVIADCEEHADGRFDLMLEGRHRARLASEELHGAGFRVGRFDVMDGRAAEPGNPAGPAVQADAPESTEAAPATAEGPETAEARAALLSVLRPLLDLLPPPARAALGAGAWSADTPAGNLADIVAHVFLDHDPYARQGILEEPDVPRRLRLVRVQLRAMLDTGE